MCWSHSVSGAFARMVLLLSYLPPHLTIVGQQGTVRCGMWDGGGWRASFQEQRITIRLFNTIRTSLTPIPNTNPPPNPNARCHTVSLTCQFVSPTSPPCPRNPPERYFILRQHAFYGWQSMDHLWFHPPRVSHHNRPLLSAIKLPTRLPFHSGGVNIASDNQWYRKKKKKRKGASWDAVRTKTETRDSTKPEIWVKSHIFSFSLFASSIPVTPQKSNYKLLAWGYSRVL
jgi:hypothetical protein